MTGMATPRQMFGRASLFNPQMTGYGGYMPPGGQMNADLIQGYLQNRGGLMDQYRASTLNRPGGVPGPLAAPGAMPGGAPGAPGPIPPPAAGPPPRPVNSTPPLQQPPTKAAPPAPPRYVGDTSGTGAQHTNLDYLMWMRQHGGANR